MTEFINYLHHLKGAMITESGCSKSNLCHEPFSFAFIAYYCVINVFQESHICETVLFPGSALNNKSY